MRPIALSLALAAASANCICASQTPTSGTALTINGSAASSGVATLDVQRRVLLTYGNEASGRTLVLTGTNQAGAKITETLTVPSGGAGTVASLQDFYTITQALPLGGGWTAAVTLGTNSTGSTPWQVPNNHITRFSLAFALGGANSANAQIEITYSQVLPSLSIYSSGAYVPPTPIVLPTDGNGMASLDRAVLGWRLTVTSGTTTATLTGMQAGVRN